MKGAYQCGTPVFLFAEGVEMVSEVGAYGGFRKAFGLDEAVEGEGIDQQLKRGGCCF